MDQSGDGLASTGARHGFSRTDWAHLPYRSFAHSRKVQDNLALSNHNCVTQWALKGRFFFKAIILTFPVPSFFIQCHHHATHNTPIMAQQICPKSRHIPSTFLLLHQLVCFGWWWLVVHAVGGDGGPQGLHHLPGHHGERWDLFRFEDNTCLQVASYDAEIGAYPYFHW